ncbi:MAG: hypothetical protein J7621_29625 [Niastella sp.]|nr:hypothetical protein [Niastella sp.]
MKYWALIVFFLLSKDISFAQPVKWAVQEMAVYKLTFSTTVKTNFSAIGSQGMDTSLTGTLQGNMQQVCTNRAIDEWFFHVSFPVIGHCRFPLPATELVAVRQSLRDGFYFSQHANGVIDSIWLPAAITAAAEHIILQLLEHYQYYLPAINDSGWRQSMLLTEGPVWATYQRGPINGHSRVVRLTGLELQQQSSPVNMIARTHQYNADVCYAFGNKGLERVEGQVVRKAKVNHKTITTLSNGFQFILQGKMKKGFQAPISGRPPAHLPGRPLFYPEKGVQQLKEAHIASSKKISVAGIMMQLQQNEITRDEYLQDKLATDIKVSFITYKDSLRLLRALFMASPVTGITFKTLRTGIVTAATPYAQEIIRDYLLLYKDDPLRSGKIIPSAGLVPDPLYLLQSTLEMLAFDTTVAEMIRSASLLALGNMAGNLQPVDPVRADTLTRALASFLQPKGDHMLLLSVLGNSGAPVALPYIRPLLSDAHEATRGYAYYALRFMREPVIDSLYGQALRQEQGPAILTNIFNALFLRGYHPALSMDLHRLVQEHIMESTRLEALRVLFEWSYRQPALLSTIRSIAAGNSNSAVRKTALQFLARADE